MANLNNQIKWKDFQLSPELLHEAVLKWQEDQVQDPVILGLIERYHFYHGDANLVVQEMMNTKEIIIAQRNSGSFRNKIFYIGAAACLLIIICMGGWWMKSNNFSKTWSFHDEGIPQYMDERVGSIDWTLINYCYQKEDYSGMLEKINEYFPRHSNNDTLLYYKAISFLELNESDSAYKYFLAVPEKSSVYSQRAHYFRLHLQDNGPDLQALRELRVVDDSNLEQAIQRDIAN